MEEELDNEPHIEIEIPDNTESEDEEPNFKEETDDDEAEALVQGKLEEESEHPEGVVLDKYLKKEDDAVLDEMKSPESLVNDIEELPESIDVMNMEGVQDLESVDLESKSTQGALKIEVAN